MDVKLCDQCEEKIEYNYLRVDLEYIAGGGWIVPPSYPLEFHKGCVGAYFAKVVG